MKTQPYIEKVDVFNNTTERFLCSRWLKRAIWIVIISSVIYFGPVIFNILSR